VIGITPEAIVIERTDGRGCFCGLSYTRAIEQAGGVPLILPQSREPGLLEQYLTLCDGFVLSGGGDMTVASGAYGRDLSPAEARTLGGLDPERDAMELWLARELVAADRPFLGICRGIQVLNVALGGSLVQDIPSQVQDALPHSFDRQTTPRNYLAHPVKIDPGSQLAQVMQLDVAQTNSWHHQAIKQVAAGLQVTAVTPDGVIEAVEVPGRRFAIGVQWHPEWLFEEMAEQRRLFEEFVRASGVNESERINETTHQRISG
jgi:putative glutamine amidotransferase